MREALQSIIATEAEARGMVAVALAEADRILSNARRECEQLAGQARQRAQADGEALMEAALREARQAEKLELASAAAEIEARLRLEEGTRQAAVSAVLRCVCSCP